MAKELEEISTDESSREQESMGRVRGAGLTIGGAIGLALLKLLGGGCANEGSENVPHVIRHDGRIVSTSRAYNQSSEHYDLGDQAYRVVDSIAKRGYIQEGDVSTMLYLVKQAEALKGDPDKRVKALGNQVFNTLGELSREYMESVGYDIRVGITHTSGYDSNNGKNVAKLHLRGATFSEVISSIDDIAGELAGKLREDAGLPRVPSEEYLKGVEKGTTDLTTPQMTALVDAAVIAADAAAIKGLMERGIGALDQKTYAGAQLLCELARKYGQDHIVDGVLTARGRSVGCGGDFIEIRMSQNLPLTDGQVGKLESARARLEPYRE